MDKIRLLCLTFGLFIGISNPGFAIQDFNQLLSECKSLEDDQPQKALSLAEAQLGEISKQNSPNLYGEFLGCAAWSAVGLNQSELAQIYAIDLETLSRHLDDSEDKVNLLRRVGSVFHRLGNRVAAVDNYQQAMVLAESLQLINVQIPILVNLGVLHSQIREEEQAIKNYQQALKLMVQQNDFNYHAPVLFNLAVTLKGQQRYVESLPLFQQIEAMITPQWPNSRRAQVYAGLASIYISLDNYDSALEYNQKALNIFADQEDKPILYYISQTNHAEIMIAQNQPQQALAIADQVWQYYQAEDNRDQLKSINNPLYALSNVFESANQPTKALSVRKLATEIDEAFQDSFNKEAMAQMQARLSDSQQRKELAELKVQQIKNQIELNSIQHNRQFILLLVAFASVVVVVFFYWQRLTKKRLHAISLRDSLTQLGNRRAIQEWMAKRKFPLAPEVRLMWLIDLDLFKDINDQYGHETGDDVLIKLSSTLVDYTNENRFVGRWGGEEFMFITDDVYEDDMAEFCDELRAAIADTTIDYQGEKISVTASIGVCRLEGMGKKAWHKALNAADKALYQAKDKGRNCMVCGE